MSQHPTLPTTPITSYRTTWTTTITAGNTAVKNGSPSVPPFENRPVISYHRQASDQSCVVGKVFDAPRRNPIGPLEHIIPVQSRQLHKFGLASGRDSNGHLKMPSIHAQLGTSNGGSANSSSEDGLKSRSGDEVVDLAFLDLHNYGDFSGSHGVSALLYGSPGRGNRRSGTRWKGRIMCGFWASRQTSR